MQSEFAYTLVSEVGGGGDISNTCNEMLDFQTDKYEVCMQDMVMATSAWDNVRAGCNMCHVATRFLPPITGENKTSRYSKLDGLVNAINAALNTEHYKYVAKTQTDEEHTRLQDFQGFGGRFILTEAVEAKAAIPAKWVVSGRGKYKVPWKVADAQPPVEAAPAYIKFELSTTSNSETKITFSKEVAYLLGITPTIATAVPAIAGGWKLEQTKVDVNRNNLTLLWVFADFISPTIVGNYLLPIIRMIPIQTLAGALEHSMFALQYYIPVKQAKFSDFRITIRDRLDGQPIKIRGLVTISLHFRTINVG